MVGAVKDNLKLLLLFIIISAIFIFPIYSHLNGWGYDDWDQHMFYHGSARISLLKFHQFPLWNPFYCGGNVLFANPQSTFLSPFFLFVLFFGEVIGLKLEIIAYLAVGLFGMYKLSRGLDIKGYAAFLPGVIFMLGSWFSLHVAEGHTTFLPFALLPFVFLFYLYSFDDLRNILFSALTLALMIFSGGIYPFYYAIMLVGAYALFDSVEKKDFKPLVIVALILVFAFLFSSVKLLPMLDLLRGPGEAPDVQYNQPYFLYRALFSRTQLSWTNNVWTGFNAVPFGAERIQKTLVGELPWGWHEYGAYIGIVPFLLFLVSLLTFRKSWKLILLAAVFLLLGLGDFSPVKLWSLLRLVPFFNALHGPSRLIIMFVFCCSLLAGKALSSIKQLQLKHLQLLLLALLFIDFFLVSKPIWADAFTNSPIKVDTYDYWDYTQIVMTSSALNMYSNMLQNLGTWNCYDRVHPRIKARPQFFDSGDAYEGFIGHAYFYDSNQSFNISFTPNRFTVNGIETDAARTLVLNQNYVSGWRVKGHKVFSLDGLVATNISAADKSVSFYYLPFSFVIGGVVSLITFAAVLFGIRKHRTP